MQYSKSTTTNINVRQDKILCRTTITISHLNAPGRQVSCNVQAFLKDITFKINEWINNPWLSQKHAHYYFKQQTIIVV